MELVRQLVCAENEGISPSAWTTAAELRTIFKATGDASPNAASRRWFVQWMTGDRTCVGDRMADGKAGDGLADVRLSARSGALLRLIVIELRRAVRIEERLCRGARPRLSARQRQVIELVLKGRSSKEIASDLRISVRTVDEHIGLICAKFGVRSRFELIAQFIETNHIKDPYADIVAAGGFRE